MAGLVPFVVGAAWVWLAPGPGVAQALAGYGAAILAFMGGCRWGFEAGAPAPSGARLAVSVLPALYGWAACLVEGALGLLAVGFAALLVADIALTRAGGAPAWWPRLRWPLTCGAVACLAVAAISPAG